MNETTEITNILNVPLDMGTIGILVAVAIGAIGFIRLAFPSLPTRLIPLMTWLAVAIAYPIIMGGFTRESIIAGACGGVMATGTHSGIRSIVDPARAIENKVDTQADKVRKRVRNKFGKSSQTNRNL